MKKNSPLYNALNQGLGQVSPWSHLTHLTTCLWMLVALIQTGSVNLTQWLPHDTLRPHLSWHGARLNLVCLFLMALFQAKTVNLGKLAWRIKQCLYGSGLVFAELPSM
ncbi:hypothetical protein E1H12_05700 [Geitlerinema sp. P-1104]|nr:hypothetical protein [Geitlerinema sp. P-1104]